jgi:hypothetical protein
MFNVGYIRDMDDTSINDVNLTYILRIYGVQSLEEILTNFYILEFLKYEKSSELKLLIPLIVYQV